MHKAARAALRHLLLCCILLIALVVLIVSLAATGPAAAGPSTANAGGARIVVSRPVVVSGARSGIAFVEPTLAVDPRRPELLFGAAITFPSANPAGGIGESVVAGFRSTDGGASWSRTELPGCHADPWARFDDFQDLDLLYVACLTADSAILVQRSLDGGGSWAEPERVPRGTGTTADKPVVVIDRSAGARRGTVYVAFGQNFPARGLRQRSLFGAVVAAAPAGGASFSEPHLIAHDNLDQQTVDAAVLADGDLVVFFQDFASRIGLLAHRRTWMAHSTDGARTFSTPALAFEQGHHENPYAVAVDSSPRHRDRLYLAVLGFWERGQGFPAAGEDPGPADLYVLASDDGGESWGRPVPVTPPPSRGAARTPAIAVDDDGVVGVAWYQAHTTPASATRCYDIYFSASLDGGATFLPPARVTPATSCPFAAPEQQGVATRWSFGGDYSGLAAAADHRFHLLWADSSTGVYRLATAAAQVVH